MENHENIIEQQEKENKRKAFITSTVFHVVLIILLLLPFITFPTPPPGQEGILVSFGQPDMGQGDDLPDTQNEVKEVEPEPPSAPEEVVEEVVEETVEEVVEESTPPEPDIVDEDPKETVKEKEVLTTEDPEAAAIKKQQEEEAKKKAEAEQKRRIAEEEAKKKADAEAKKKAEEEAKRKAAEAEAKRKADEEAKKQAEYEAAKKQYGDVFGKGKGETGTDGNQGDPNGDPNADNLEGISTGSGKVGGGLGDRGVKYEPSIKDQSQKTGRVVVKVCVDNNGDVVSADYTQRGSTTTDGDLKRLAIASAKRFKFTKSTIDKQCGTITIDFKVK